jgi:hypothetical protein
VYDDSVIWLVAASGSSSSTEAFELDENLFRPLVDGPWAGEDVRDVYLEAVAWWEDELDHIDREVSD